MTTLVSYSTGTATVAANGTTVTGTGSIWSGVNARPGDIFQIGDFQSVITDVTDTTHLVIPPWGGGAQTGVAYTIWQVSPQRFAGAQAMADVSTLVAALNTSGFYVFVDVSLTVPDPSLGNDGQYAFQPTTGKTWVKSAGAWTFIGIYKAFQLKGAWSSATAYSVGDLVTLNGSSYACVLAHTNQTPPNTTYWQLLASKGDPGATGATGATYGGTSTTSLAIGTGSAPFTTQSGLAYQNGARVRATATAGAIGWLEGVVTYSGTTLTITGDKSSGSGTGTAWTFNVAGEPGAGDMSSANNLSEVNPATASANLGVVRYGGAQSLTAAQQAQARANVGMTKKNYLLNSAMMVSQENGTTAGTTSGYYPADMWTIQTSAMGTGTFSAAQVASSSPAGSPNRLRLTVTAAQATVGSSLVYLQQKIEGYRVADLQWGTASAKTITFQVGVKAPVAGTYVVQISNAIPDAFQSGFITIGAGEVNTDVVKSVVLTGVTSGTWNKDNTAGFLVQLFLMHSAQTANVFATNGNVFEMFDVGLYEGSSAPTFQVPDFSLELSNCKRYYNSSWDYGTKPGTAWTVGADQFKYAHPIASFSASWSIPPMRSSFTPTFYDASGASGAVSYYNNSSGVWSNGGTITTTAGKQTMIFIQNGVANAAFTNFGWVANNRM